MSEVAETTATAQSEEIVRSQQPGELQNIQAAYRLTGKNYLKWSQLVRAVLKGKGKISHLMGTGPKTGDPRFEAWDEEDSMIMAWLWNSMIPEISDTCMFLATAKDIWDAIQQTYSKARDAAQVYEDAHEFLNFLLNELVDILEKESHAAKRSPETSSPSEKTANGPKNVQANGVKKEPLVTWVHKNFQGILTNETRCLRCETVTARDETFLDLSLDIEQNSSITSCLKNFSSTETLNAEDKFFCDKCCSLQEAQKRMKIKKAPHILVIHLKRFKYIEQLGRYKKLSYRVVFPLELKLSNTVEDADSEYSLFAVVVHVGSGPNHGHYVSLVKSHNHWLFFDDENVEMIDESAVQTFFGSAQEYSSNTDHGYILFYESLATSSKS
ncbi:hypothetical protein HHK36_004011 [Tetracentron sinense]|uniref:ubiquitinyl hydrolase 1 n=1 Tax=Tetracentron sinense TaxID=13715 RepID=A0A834ZU07_TETSI|nr:hypothetical protein HHK36_004011 [Tetracentron sinense]